MGLPIPDEYLPSTMKFPFVSVDLHFRRHFHVRRHVHVRRHGVSYHMTGTSTCKSNNFRLDLMAL